MMVMQDAAIKEESASAATPAAPRNKSAEARSGGVPAFQWPQIRRSDSSGTGAEPLGGGTGAPEVRRVFPIPDAPGGGKRSTGA